MPAGKRGHEKGGPGHPTPHPELSESSCSAEAWEHSQSRSAPEAYRDFCQHSDEWIVPQRTVEAARSSSLWVLTLTLWGKLPGNSAQIINSFLSCWDSLSCGHTPLRYLIQITAPRMLLKKKPLNQGRVHKTISRKQGKGHKSNAPHLRPLLGRRLQLVALSSWPMEMCKCDFRKAWRWWNHSVSLEVRLIMSQKLEHESM